MGRRPLRPLERVQGPGEVAVEPFLLKLPLPRVYGVLRGEAVEVPQLPRRVLGQLVGVVLDLVTVNRYMSRKIREKILNNFILTVGFVVADYLGECRSV